MKDQILKIAGVKSEKEFYKKYPSEEAFMKAHKKEFKKAAMGASMVKKQLDQLTDFGNPPQARVGDFVGPTAGGNLPPVSPVSFSKLYDANDLNVTGTNNQQRMQAANLKAQQQQAAAAQKTADKKSGGFDVGQAIQLGTQVASMMGKNGKRIPKYQNAGIISSSNQSYNLPNAPQSLPANSSPQIQKSDLTIPQPAQPESSQPSKLNKYLGTAGKVLDGIQKLKAEKKALDQSNQFSQVSGVVAQAAGTRPEQARRRYVRPEDQILNPGELNNPYGAGTNVLNARYGAEIQNTYAPNDIYADLGYEPLNNSVKQYRRGGHIPIAQSGFSDFAGSPQGSQAATAVGDFGSTFAGGDYGESNAGGDIGGEVGSSIGSIFGPPGAMIGRAVGDFAGRLLDKNPQRTRAFQEQGKGNLQRSAFQQGAQQLQAQNSGFMEDGGWMNPEYNPQVITKFGDVDVSDIHNIFTRGMDTLRAGGHLKDYTPPSEEAMQTYAMGGELQTHWGGHMEPMSYNPYLPGDGITYMPHGQSHDETNGRGQSGIGITFGNNPVEVERGEPITKLQDGGTGEDSAMVYGNMYIPNYGVSELEDENAKGKKFKHYANNLSKIEARQNKVIDKATNLVNDSNENNSFGQLSLASGQASLIGANMKLKNIADKKQVLANVQNAILDTAKEHGLVADDLARGKVKVDKEAAKQARFGAKMEVAQYGYNNAYDKSISYGYNLPKNTVSKQEETEKSKSKDNNTKKIISDDYHSKYGLTPWEGNTSGLGKKTASEFTTKEWDNVADSLGFHPKTSDPNKEFQEFLLKNPESASLIKDRHQKLYGKDPFIDGKLGAGWAVSDLKNLRKTRTEETIIPNAKKSYIPGMKDVGLTGQPIKFDPISKVKEPNTWMKDAFDVANTFIPRFRGTNQEPLDPNQLGAEMYSLATNQLEPVQAQQYQPRLQQPYDISYQDMLNANQSDFNSVQRQVGGNPAALAALAGQKYGANEKVLGEQFRANQANKAGIYNQNLQTLNDATLKNLGILEQQYVRQSQAKSNTKAQAQAALQSIASKIAQNKLENRKVGVNENLYNFRFDPTTGRAINENDLAQFNMQGNPFARLNSSSGELAEGYENTYNSAGKIIGARKTPKDDKAKRNGAIVKALKNL